MQVIETVTLENHEPGSNKFYTVKLESNDDTFAVGYVYGPIGTVLGTGYKVQGVDQTTAKREYDKLIAKKMKDHYNPVNAAGPSAVPVIDKVDSGIRAQLLNSIDQGQAEQLVSDDGWWMQEKFDGKRTLIRKDGEQVVGINRKGLVVALPQPIVQQALTLDGRQWLMDGEAVGDIYMAFDLLERGGIDLRAKPYSLRLAALEHLVSQGVASFA